MNNLTDAIREAYVIASSSKAIVDTLEFTLIDEPEVETLRIVAAIDDLIVTRGDGKIVFWAVPFRIKPPDVSNEGARTLDIAVDIVDEAVLKYAESLIATMSQVRITHRTWIVADNTEPQSSAPLVMYLAGLSIGDTQITLQAGFADIVNQNFPNEYYTPERFPGLRY